MTEQIPINKAGESVHFYGVYGLYQRWWKKKSTFSYMTMPRPYHGFMCVLSEEMKITSKNGEQRSFKYGDILYIPKGLCYSVEFYDSKTEFNSLLVNFLMRDEKKGEFVFYNDITRLVSSASARYTDDFYTIINQYAAAVNNRFSIMSAFYSLLDNLARHQEKKMLMSNEYNLIAPAIIYMDSHVNESLSVPELAKMCLMSETCFRKHFRKYMGISPSKYKIKAKIRKAKQMLKTDAITAEDIVTELGFYDLSYFYKIFKRETGVTPAEYLQKENKKL